MSLNSSHRPHRKGHDYYDRGIYLITIVVKHRDALFGRLNMDIQHPGVVLSPLGLAVQEEWDRIPNVAREKGRRIRVLAKVTMPDHFHGVIFVEERMDVSVGMIIRGFKAVCTQRWRALMAFGNILLLHKPVKEQVFCHRRARVGQLTADERQRLGITGPCHDDTLTSLPYTDTQAWRRERDTWIADAQDGVVLVTPGISPGEREMKNLAIANRLPLIHLQKEPITHKPERARFDACAEGSLLILAPWPEDLDSMRSRTDMGGTAAGSCPSAASIVSDYDRFHNLNELARMICELDTRSVPMTMRMMGER